MKKIDFSFYRLLPCMIMFVYSCMIMSSCIKNADDGEDKPKPEPTDTIPVVNDSTAIVIDSAFVASVGDMVTEWMASYTGFDIRQNVNSMIRRNVAFSENGTYECHVQGIVDMEDTLSYKELEHERGTYAFDVERQMMTYQVEYDSLLDFRSDQMVFYPGKMLNGMTQVASYDERIYFTAEKEGKRSWVRTDDNLMSPIDHTVRLVYLMNRSE